jgi:hypothetical protein
MRAPVLRRVECLCVAEDVVVQLSRSSFRRAPQLRGRLALVFYPSPSETRHEVLTAIKDVKSTTIVTCVYTCSWS